MEIANSQEQKQLQKLSPEMRQSLDVLQMPSPDLRELVAIECAKNPTIEVCDGPLELVEARSRRSGGDSWDPLANVAAAVSLEFFLLQQVPDWSPLEKKILAALLEALDGRGFFTGDLGAITNALRCDFATVEAVYAELKALQPLGIGAKDLRECLLIQLHQLNRSAEVSLATEIVEKYFDELRSGKIDLIGKNLKTRRSKIIEAGRRIVGLNFSPISGFSNEHAIAIVSDLKIFKSGGEWIVEFNETSIPVVRFSKMYREIGCEGGAVSGEAEKYLRRNARNGRALMMALDRRRATLIAITNAILVRQIDFFEDGIKSMRPMRLRDVAGDVNLHISTVSRAIGGKYVHTPHGIFAMETFFSSGTAGECVISRLAIGEMIREMVNAAEIKLTDCEISNALRCRGIKIARRTVAKYRKSLNLPNSRKSLALPSGKSLQTKKSENFSDGRTVFP